MTKLNIRDTNEKKNERNRPMLINSQNIKHAKNLFCLKRISACLEERERDRRKK
jgi:hypothetical protein